jgi:hypothetical protein
MELAKAVPTQVTAHSLQGLVVVKCRVREWHPIYDSDATATCLGQLLSLSTAKQENGYRYGISQYKNDEVSTARR